LSCLLYTSAVTAYLFFQSFADCQVPHLHFEHLTIDQGLSDNGVFGILQDVRGFMWFGTQDGLNKYDGYGFTVYKNDPLDSTSIGINNIPEIFEDRSGTLWVRTPSRYLGMFDRVTEKFRYCLQGIRVWDIHEDASGEVWFATFGSGLYKYERADGSFRQYKMTNDTLTCISEGSGGIGRILWIGTASGLDRFDPANGSVTHFEPCPRCFLNAVQEDSTELFWIGTNQGLYQFTAATGLFRFYPVDKSLRRNGKREIIEGIYEDSNRMLWIGSGNRLFRFNRATATFVSFAYDTSPAPAQFKNATPFYEDRAGRLWLRTLGKGLGLYDRVRSRFVSYMNDPGDPYSLNDNTVNELYEDRAGTLWIGTTWGGVNKLDRARKAFRHYAHDPANPKSLSHKIVYSLCEGRSGILWVGTQGGLDRFDPTTGTCTHYRHDPKNPHSLGSDVVRAVLEDSKGVLWVGTEGSGLNRLDPDGRGGRIVTHARFSHYTHDAGNPGSLGGNYILSLFEDRVGRIWIGTSDAGLDQCDRNTGIFRHYRNDPADSGSLSMNWVNAIYEDRASRLWVGTGGSGYGPLHRLDRTTGKFVHYRYDPTGVKGPSIGSVHSIYEARSGALWIGTAVSLEKFEPSTETFTHFTARQSLAEGFVEGILEDDRGYLWLKTGKGITKFNPQTGTFRDYDRNEGVPINPTWGKACCKDKDGQMFFGGINGFVCFHPDSIRDNPYVPPIVITAFKKFDKPVKLDTAISEKKVLELSYKDNVISFEFVALSYTNPKNNEYAYKLEGFDRDWTYCGTRRYASYTNLDGGSYVFRVKGSNNDGVWNEEGASIAVIVTPPFWKTSWFTALLFVAAASLIGGSIWYVEITRLRRKLRVTEQEHALERERLRIARDMHDEVGANLTEIAILSELVRRDIRKPEESEPNVQKIALMARALIDSISEIIWAMNPKNDMLDHLAGYLREYASEYFGMTPIACHFDFPDQVSHHPLSAEVRRNIFLTMKEAVNNVVKHSGATSVELRCRVSDHEVEFSIQDNGRGFMMETLNQSGNGLRNMRKRIEDINGDFQIESQPGRGTRIRLTVPLV
jgi:two-component system sensor histidine kinase ChiS